jgi:riboflavin synthase
LFTGLIEEVGRIVSMRRTPTGARLAVRCGMAGLETGESIAVNGACQTIAALSRDGFTCDLLRETLRVTNLGKLRPGAWVNLERAMRPGDRLGGHLVNGHVDGTARVLSISERPARIELLAPEDLSRYIVSKGSVALDGVSLTVGPDPAEGRFEVFIIPHTWEHTNLKHLKRGGEVNIEIDIVAKYIEAFTRQGRGDNQ